MGQAMNKSKEEKASIKSSDLTALRDIMEEEMYATDIQSAENFDDFYHAVHKIFQELRKRTGAMQLRLPSSAEIKNAYQQHHKTKGTKLEEGECKQIIRALIKVEDIEIGKAVEILALIYGAPICAFLGKKVIPGANSFSDDVVIPLATAAAALFLTKTNKL